VIIDAAGTSAMVVGVSGSVITVRTQVDVKAVWGGISGDMANQTDLTDALEAQAAATGQRLLKNQGTDNAGRWLAIDEDGDIVPVPAPDTAEFAGPYATVDDIPTPYDKNDLYLVGTAPPYAIYVAIGDNLKQIGETEFNPSNYYAKGEDIVMAKKKKIFGTTESGEQHEIIGLNEYEINGQTYDQVEVGSEAAHLNLNTNDDPVYGTHSTVDTPSGKEILLYKSDINTGDGSSILNLYLDAVNGDNTNDGLSAATPKKTIAGFRSIVEGKIFNLKSIYWNFADGVYEFDHILTDVPVERVRLNGTGVDKVTIDCSNITATVRVFLRAFHILDLTFLYPDNLSFIFYSTYVGLYSCAISVKWLLICSGYLDFDGTVQALNNSRFNLFGSFLDLRYLTELKAVRNNPGVNENNLFQLYAGSGCSSSETNPNWILTLYEADNVTPAPVGSKVDVWFSPMIEIHKGFAVTNRDKLRFEDIETAPFSSEIIQSGAEYLVVPKGIANEPAFQYSNAEKETGKYWLDNEPVYSKVLTPNIPMPNATTVGIPHNITEGIANLISLKGIFGNDTLKFETPFTGSAQSGIYVNGGYVNISASTDLSQYTLYYIIIEYTKKSTPVPA
jgi:hypothetical protein